MPIRVTIDLNADVGEHPDAADLAVIPHVTSVNIACGAHAGDAGLMRAAAVAAHTHDVAVGAHPGFPDPKYAGRREQQMLPDDVEKLVTAQVGALLSVVAREGIPVRHVKPHGALYAMAARDLRLARAVVRAAKVVEPSLRIFAPPASCLVIAAEEAGLAAVAEGFADRAYHADGALVSRDEPSAVITDRALVIARAMAMVRERTVQAIEGADISLAIDTICIHGDTPGAAGLAAALRLAFRDAGIAVAAPG